MLKKLIPDEYYNSIEDIPYNKLYAQGIRLILTDLDNTLISYKEADPNNKLYIWKEQMEAMGFEIIIVSNSRKERVEHFSNLLKVPYVKFAKKPLLFGMKKAIKKASRSYKSEEIIVLGDQLMTDVFAAKRLKLQMILIQAIDKKTEILPTKLNRKIENFFLDKIERYHPRLYQQKLDKYVREKNAK